MFGRILNLKGILTLFLGSLLLAGSLGISHMGMSMDMDGSMTDCPFLPGVSICMMSPLEMVAASQSFLGEIVLNTDSSLLLLLASATAISTAFFTFFSLLIFSYLNIPAPRSWVGVHIRRSAPHPENIPCYRGGSFSSSDSHLPARRDRSASPIYG